MIFEDDEILNILEKDVYDEDIVKYENDSDSYPEYVPDVSKFRCKQMKFIEDKGKTRNIIHVISGPTRNAHIADDFKLFNHHTLGDINSEEINALLSLLLLTAAMKDYYLAVKLLLPVFIIDCLRLNNKATRKERKNRSSWLL